MSIKCDHDIHSLQPRSCARGALALLFVLGATWTFGVVHILNETTLTAYLFTFANAFQGMFIFIFLCVLSRKVLFMSFYSAQILSIFVLMVEIISLKCLLLLLIGSGRVLQNVQECAMLFWMLEIRKSEFWTITTVEAYEKI